MSLPWIGLFVALWLAVILLLVLVLGLIRTIRALDDSPLTRRPPIPDPGGPPTGMSAPVISGYERLAFAGDGSQGHVVLFLGSTCGACHRLAAEIRAQRSGSVADLISSRFGMLLVTDAAGREGFADLGASEIVTQVDGELARAWAVPGTPFAIAIDHAGTVRSSRFVSQISQLRDLADMLDHASPEALSAVASSDR